MLREFLREGLAIHALREAWILQGPDALTAQAKLTKHLDLPTFHVESMLWVRQVEVRTVLDQAIWNSEGGPATYYGILDGRRTWIVRNEVQPLRSFGVPDISHKQRTYPAVLSSQAMHELCAWIERVASVNRLLFLRAHTCRALFHLLGGVSGEDRITVFGQRLTKRASDLLRWYHNEYVANGKAPDYAHRDT